MDMVEEEMLLSSVEKGSGVEGSVEEGSVEEGEEPPHDQSAPRVLSRWRWWPLVELIALIKLALPTVSECTSTTHVPLPHTHTHAHTRTHARTHTHTHTHTQVLMLFFQQFVYSTAILFAGHISGSSRELDAVCKSPPPHTVSWAILKNQYYV